MCGENPAQSLSYRARKGSSPRVRGKRSPLESRDRDNGLIPACAGKTGRFYTRPGENRAHPRVCGENVGGTTTVGTGAGSSPRVRGKPTISRPRAPVTRLIPACAGKTSLSFDFSELSRAHPRVCGENSLPSQAGLTCPGSSPRVRGKPALADPRGLTAGLIPACAGKTHPINTFSSLRRAHPRVCGENQGHAAQLTLFVGSSPRVRGKPRLCRCAFWCSGLIPACAGKTPGRRERRSLSRAHPRVCGENREARRSPPR